MNVSETHEAALREHSREEAQATSIHHDWPVLALWSLTARTCGDVSLERAFGEAASFGNSPLTARPTHLPTHSLTD